MEKEKNILVISTSKLSYTETFVKAHLEQLKGRVFHLYGWDLDYKTINNESLRQLYPLKKASRLKSLLPHYIYFRLQQRKNKYYTKEALIKRFMLEHEIDLVLAEYGTSGSFITPICKDLKVPLIVHFHGIDASKYELLETFKEGYQAMFKYASYVIAVSQRMLRDIINMGCPEEKVIYNIYGPNEEFTAIAPNYKSNNIIAIGHQNFKKAPYLTILAFNKVVTKHPNIKLHFAGGGELLEVSVNLVNALGIQDKVVFHGKLPRKDVIALLKESFLFVQHSVVARDGNSEGTPVAILESMMAGLPVVSTYHAGIPDVVINGETGFLVDEKDVDAMADAISTLVKDRSKAERMGQAGRERAFKEFHIDKHINKLNELIDSINISKR
jgi:glycosyltransferase involved in cell wall biosynthesis